MSNKNGRLWYKSTAYIGIIVGILLALNGIFIYTTRSYSSDFSVSVNPMQGSVLQGGVIQTTVTVKGGDGYVHPVSLTASEQPSENIVITFIPSMGKPTPTYASTVTINVASNVPASDYTIIIQGTGADGKEHTCTYTLAVVLPNVLDAFYPSGWIGDWGDITLEDAFRYSPYLGRTSTKITYSAALSQGKGWTGIYWQYPDNNWGDTPQARDLTGVTKLTFWAKGEKGGEKVEFKVGGITGKYPDSIYPAVSTGVIVLSSEWQQYTIDLSGKDLSHVIGGFCWVTNKKQNPYGCTIYLDEVRFE